MTQLVDHDADRRLFVYGTLVPGGPNEHVLASLPGTWVSATVTGELLAVGWAAEMGFPALRLDAAGPAVHGQVFTSDELPANWARLDEFEGNAYERVVTNCVAETGELLACHVYTAKSECPDPSADR